MIHNTAIIHPKARLSRNVSVGPHTIIGEAVEIGTNTQIGPNCVIDGATKIGNNCEIFTGAIIGTISQDKKYKGGPGFLEIGNNNKIREYVTINLSTGEKSKTVIENDNLIMAYSHIAHDCKVGNGVVIANAGTLAGHVVVENSAVLGGLAAVHQFTRIGTLSIIGGCSKVVADIVPFSMCDGHPARVYGVNSIGLDRIGIGKDVKTNIKKAFKILFSMKLNTKNAIEKVRNEIPECREVSYLINFIESSERGITR